MKELRHYWKLFVDVWHLFKNFSNPDGSCEFWAAYEIQVSSLDIQHQESQLYQDLIIAVTKELLKIEKDKNKKGLEVKDRNTSVSS